MTKMREGTSQQLREAAQLPPGPRLIAKLVLGLYRTSTKIVHQ